MRASLVHGVLFALFLSPSAALATSAVRGFDESPEAAAEKAYRDFARLEPRAGSMRGDSAYALAKAVSDIDFDDAPTIKDYRRLFSRLRDERFQNDPDKAGFSRRISWMYPHDGCFTRAAVMSKRASEMGFTRPANFFVFGRLEVKTGNAPDGKVAWWYHVAPVVNDREGRSWVIDPAIEPSGPLLVNLWLKRMVPAVTDVKVALCSAYDWEPYRPCDESTAANQSNMVNRQLTEFLPAERTNLIKMKRDVDKELGESPPWTQDR